MAEAREVIYKGEKRIITQEDFARFHSKYQVEDSGCWIWAGGAGWGDGYGGFAWKGIQIRAHRMSYLMFNGLELDKLLVCHSCDVPQCVNPEHLWTGTTADNMKDRDKKGRGPVGEKNGMWGKPALTGEKHPCYIPGPVAEEKKSKGYRLTETDALAVLKLKADGHGPAYIMRATGFPYATVSGVCQGKIWKRLL